MNFFGPTGLISVFAGARLRLGEPDCSADVSSPSTKPNASFGSTDAEWALSRHA